MKATLTGPIHLEGSPEEFAAFWRLLNGKAEHPGAPPASPPGMRDCPNCGKLFATSQGLAIHRTRVHRSTPAAWPMEPPRRRRLRRDAIDVEPLAREYVALAQPPALSTFLKGKVGHVSAYARFKAEVQRLQALKAREDLEALHAKLGQAAAKADPRPGRPENQARWSLMAAEAS